MINSWLLLACAEALQPHITDFDMKTELQQGLGFWGMDSGSALLVWFNKYAPGLVKNFENKPLEVVNNEN